MNAQPSQPVVVAVGHGPVDAALAFAAEEASRAGCGIRLVHVVHLVAQGPELVLVAETDLERVGRQALDAAYSRAHDVAPGVPITTALKIGGVVPAVIDMARDARMIVLEHRDLSRAKRITTRSIASGVAAHARVPVVSVPSTWSPAPPTTEPAIVTVGVDVPDRSGQLLRDAAAEARGRGTVLRVLHTWSFPGAYDDIVVLSERQRWTDRASVEVQAAVDGLGADVDGVPVWIEVRQARAADALVEASRDSELLVVGRHDPLVPIGSHLGPVARAVLRQSACPVLLADPPPRRGRRRASTAADVAQPA